MIERNTGKVRIYAAGGAGARIAQEILDWTGESRVGYSELEICFVDTSKSNLDPSKVSEKDVYLIDGVDGSGQVRRLHADSIEPRIKDIIQSFNPVDLNIVIHALSGGSGSVLGVLLTKELLERNLPVVVITIGDESTKLFTKNTLNTLKSYEAVASKTQAPVIMSYHRNTGSTERKEVNKYIINMINDLLILFSNQHIGLDTQDLKHWLRYDVVTDFPPQVAYLTTITSEENIKQIKKDFGTPITVATLGLEGESTDFLVPVEYQTEGTITQEVSDMLYSKTTHYVIYDGLFDHVSNSLNERIKEIDQITQSRVKRTSMLSDDDDVQDNGLVF